MIIVKVPRIYHFKGFDMRNLQYEVRIYQKSHNKAKMTVFVWFVHGRYIGTICGF